MQYKFVDTNLNRINEYSLWVYNEVQYPPSIFTNFNEQELLSIGVYTVKYPAAEQPEGFYVSDYELEMVDGEVVATPVFTEFPKSVPQVVSKAQGKATLLAGGFLDAAEAFIDGIQDVQEKRMAILAFNETNEWRRDSPFLQQMAITLGLSPEQLDDLFIVAATIVL